MEGLWRRVEQACEWDVTEGFSSSDSERETVFVHSQIRSRSPPD